MSLYGLSIRRPVLAVVLSLAIVLFGALAFFELGVREFPSVDPPLITVSTNYRGANADVIESQVTEPLEDAVNGVSGIRTLTSVSRAGRSTVRVEFDLGADLERAANDVRDRVFGALDNLPPDIDPPEVSKADADARPILMLWVRSDRRTLLDLSRLADETFAERFQTIDGVSRVDIWGDKTPAMRLWLDPQRLAAHRLSPLDVRDAVARENLELPTGRIEGDSVELAVRTLSRLNTPDEFEELILKESGGRLVRLGDVGRAEVAPRNERTALKNEGVPMVAVVLRPQPGVNYIELANEFYRRVERIRPGLPGDIEIGYGFDTTQYIRRSIAEVVQSVFIALSLVVLVIFAFLRDWRTTLIPALVIPVSLVGAFGLMWAAGFSINVLTLLALVLAIGLVVDDAIVVLENIYSKIEAGRPPLAAGVSGTREIFFAVIATTLALVSVLMPLLFMGGLTGRLFREFGAVLAGAVAISSFVALTLTPMLSSRLLKRRAVQPWLYRRTERFYRALARGYRGGLEGFLGRRWLVFPLLTACLALSVLLWKVLPSELAPLEDRSSLRLSSTAPEGATYAYMDRFMDQLVTEVADEVPERRTLVSVTSPGFGASSSTNSGFARLILTEPSERRRSQSQIAADLDRRLRRLTGANTRISESPTISVGRRGGPPIQFVLQAPDLPALEEVLPRFIEEARRHPVLSFVDADLKFTNPELRVSIDRARARDLGISARDIAQTLQLSLAEQRLGFFLLGGKQYEVIVQVDRGNRDETADLRGLYVPSASGDPVLLDRLVTVTEESRPPQLFRFDRYVSATLSAGLAPGETIDRGIAAMQEVAERVLDPTFETALSGQARDFVEASNALLWAFVLAFVLVYLVLAGQFESFRDPLIILLTVPLALAGALLALWYFGQTLNLFSKIGIMMLIGLVTKNGILIVEFANQRRAAGSGIAEAVADAATARFRPVLMTTLSTALGILPIALALGAGSESRVPMGIAILGGLLVGTCLTLYAVPALYTYLTRRELRVVPGEDEASAEPPPPEPEPGPAPSPAGG